MTNTEIYEQTQELARRLALAYGYVADVDMFRRNSPNPRGSHFFQLAFIAQGFLCGHEMEDVIPEDEDYE